ncbi:hypothetical protein LOD99_4120 [Oopsacas minuta]|uniref:Uncharacterized protein n=1 Tax=Oopsacas minuta TaxID=111878 RepID=A0AAV7JW67_9METZ|nr:hypothetical protein LOD99_4120 [Oopsacas minuta]
MIAHVEEKFDDLQKVLDDRKREVMDKLDYIYKDTLSFIQKGELQREHVQDLITKSKAYKKLPMNGHILTELESINSKVNELLAGLPDKAKYKDIDYIMDHDIKSIMKGLGCFRLEYTQKVLPVNIIDTNTLMSKYKFTPFTMTRDDQENIYNFTTDSQVVVMNRAGEMLKQFKPSNMPGQVNSGYIHWNKHLLYIVAGNNNSVTVCNEDGKLVKIFGKEGKNSGEFKNPLSIAVSNINGDIYVLEEGNNRVQVLNSKYIPSRFIGYYIEHPGQIKNPCELALTEEDHVIVAQRNIPSINIYNSQGIVLVQFGSTSIDGLVFMPGAMCISHTGQLLLTDLLQDQIVVYDKDKLTMWTVGSPGIKRGEFSCPAGMVCMKDGTVYICDMRNQRIQVYNQDSMILGDN